jgi:hypothetical protein
VSVERCRLLDELEARDVAKVDAHLGSILRISCGGNLRTKLDSVQLKVCYRDSLCIDFYSVLVFCA